MLSRILNFLEKEKFSKKDKCYKINSNIEIEFYPLIGKENQLTKEKIKIFIKDLIKKDPSHLVTGGYLIENIETRPTNPYLILYENAIPKIILNINQNRFLVISEAELTENSLMFILQIVNFWNEVFVFTSGNVLMNFFTENLKYTDISYNVVFILKNFLPLELGLPNSYEYIELDFRKDNHENLKYKDIMNESYNYNLDEKKLLTHFKRNPHALIIDQNKEICSKAKCNSFNEELSVIGGVATKMGHRKKGLGKFVSYKITQILQKYSKTVALETESDNFPAIKIYRSIGFVEVGKSMFIDKNTYVIKEIRGNRDY